jgi:hypothetical protein
MLKASPIFPHLAAPPPGISHHSPELKSLLPVARRFDAKEAGLVAQERLGAVLNEQLGPDCSRSPAAAFDRAQGRRPPAWISFSPSGRAIPGDRPRSRRKPCA